MPKGTELTREQFCHIEEQIGQRLSNSLLSTKRITLLITAEAAYVKSLAQQNNHTGIVDLSQHRLLLFDDISDDGLGIFHDLERLLVPDLVEMPRVSLKERLRGIEIINATIVVLNLLIFFVLQITGYQEKAVDAGSLFWLAIEVNHEYYRLFTSMFLHGSIEHVLYNMLTLAVIGNTLEKVVGKWKYLLIYLCSGLVAGFTSMSYNMEKENIIRSIGASGAIFGVVGAVLFIVLINKGRIENLGKRQIILFAALSLYGGFTSTGVDNIAHIGGLISGFVFAVILYRKPKKRGVVS